MLESVPNVALKDRIAALLRAEIFSGRMEDGAEITQEEVATALSVSRIPVREAFLQLENEGLLQRLPTRRVRIAGITAQRMEQNFRFLAAVESEIARMGTFAPADLERLESILHACKETLEQNDTEGLYQTEEAFHLSLAAPLNNPTLQQLYSNQRRSLLAGAARNMHLDWEALLAADEQILNAVKKPCASELDHRIRAYYDMLMQFAAKEASVWNS